MKRLVDEQRERQQRPPGRRKGQIVADEEAEVRREGRSPRNQRRTALDDIWEGR